MLQLTAEEVASLRSQFATSNKGRGGRRYAPYAFTEQGVAMLSTVLNSERAIQVNIEDQRKGEKNFAALGDYSEAEGFEVRIKRETRHISEKGGHDDKGNGITEGQSARFYMSAKYRLCLRTDRIRDRNQRQRRFHRVKKLDGGLGMQAVGEQCDRFADYFPGRKHLDPLVAALLQ